jgi:hypothetical protein
LKLTLGVNEVFEAICNVGFERKFVSKGVSKLGSTLKRISDSDRSQPKNKEVEKTKRNTTPTPKIPNLNDLPKYETVLTPTLHPEMKKSPSFKERLASIFWIGSPTPKMNSPSPMISQEVKVDNSVLLEKIKFEEIFKNQNLKKSFKQFLEKEFFESGLNFIDEVERFKTEIKEEELFDESITIIQRFILPKSPEEIPIDKNERNNLLLKYKDLHLNKFEKFPKDFFDEIQEKSKIYIKDEHFKNFLISDEFIHYLFDEESLIYSEGKMYSKTQYEGYFKQAGITEIDLKDQSMLREM